MKSWQAEGLTADEKYDIEEYADMMKALANAATEGNLEQVMSTIMNHDVCCISVNVR